MHARRGSTQSERPRLSAWIWRLFSRLGGVGGFPGGRRGARTASGTISGGGRTAGPWQDGAGCRWPGRWTRAADLILDHPTEPLAFEIASSPSHSRAGLRALVEHHPRFEGRAYLAAPQAPVTHPESTDSGVGSLPLDDLLLAIGTQTRQALSARVSVRASLQSARQLAYNLHTSLQSAHHADGVFEAMGPMEGWFSSPSAVGQRA